MLTFKGRKEDMRLVRGQGQYSSDWNMPGQLHACFLRADRAHAAIRSIDAAAAKSMDGVVAVLDGRDIADAGMRTDRKSTRLNSSHQHRSRMPSSA